MSQKHGWGSSLYSVRVAPELNCAVTTSVALTEDPQPSLLMLMKIIILKYIFQTK